MGKLLEELVISVVGRSIETVIDGFITLRPGKSSVLSRFALYRLDMLPTVTSFRGGKSGDCSPDILEYALLLVRPSEIFVGGRSLDVVDRPPKL